MINTRLGNRLLVLLATPATVAVALAGCGGGGSSSTTGASPPSVAVIKRCVIRDGARDVSAESERGGAEGSLYGILPRGGTFEVTVRTPLDQPSGGSAKFRYGMLLGKPPSAADRAAVEACAR